MSQNRITRRQNWHKNKKKITKNHSCDVVFKGNVEGFF